MLELVGQMVDGVGRLVTQHIALAKLEIAEELRGLGREVGKVAAFAPFLALGYVLWCGALVALLSKPLGWPWAFFLVGSANVAVGSFGVLRALGHLKAHSPGLNGTLAEIKSTAAVLAHPTQAAQLEVHRAK